MNALQTALRRLVIATVVVYLALAGLGVYVYISVGGIAKETTSALCTLRADLEGRVATSRAFLEENPDGIPGIPAKVIQDGIKNQERTIEALSSLTC